jgi:hypothetical protein
MRNENNEWLVVSAGIIALLLALYFLPEWTKMWESYKQLLIYRIK